MKKFMIIMLVLVLSVSVAACGRRDNNTGTTTIPSTGTNILPDMTQPMDTNIPDPSVDSTMPMYTAGTDTTDNTDSTGVASGNNTNGSQSGMGSN